MPESASDFEGKSRSLVPRQRIDKDRGNLVWRVKMAEIRLQEGESLENALRRFKRKVQSEDIIKEVKRHSYYLKPGEKRRVKSALARKRARKKIRREGSFGTDARRENK
jgi:small subunit ribosomal protein S21